MYKAKKQVIDMFHLTVPVSVVILLAADVCAKPLVANAICELDRPSETLFSGTSLTVGVGTLLYHTIMGCYNVTMN
jgi:hypothetical protein